MVRDLYDIDAINLMLAAHPTENIYENIRKLFRLYGINTIIFRPERWGVVDERFDGSLGVMFEEYPADLYDSMYQYYGGQDKDIFITNIESDWQAHGAGCRARDECLEMENHAENVACCWSTTCNYITTLDYLPWEDCQVIVCDETKFTRAAYVLKQLTKRQLAVEAARAAHPNAVVRLWHLAEVNFYGTEDWQFFTMLELIGQMSRKPDFIGLSLYDMAGDVEVALQYAMDVTGLPAERFIISETGTSQINNQYDIIYNRIDNLFAMGVRLAFIWSLDVAPNDSEWSIVDPLTGEERGGMQALRELNDKWR
jgi:hypothetical protein